jgi:hypothetical protein
MAMRGNADTAIPLTQDQAIRSLLVVVDKQREILGNVFNGTNVTDIPQMWCLYKEVQGYFEAGMSVPEDITLLWSDDNWGNLRRLPLANETGRAGGAGEFSSLLAYEDHMYFKSSTIARKETILVFSTETNSALSRCLLSL